MFTESKLKNNHTFLSQEIQKRCFIFFFKNNFYLISHLKNKQTNKKQYHNNKNSTNVNNYFLFMAKLVYGSYTSFYKAKKLENSCRDHSSKNGVFMIDEFRLTAFEHKEGNTLKALSPFPGTIFK